MQNRFSKIYETNEWGYGSGVGSLPLNTIEYIKFLNMFIAHNEIKSVIDFGCGDWQFSQFIQWGKASYLGLDIIELVILRNQQQYQREGILFDIFRQDLPQADLIICKDVFQHLPNELIRGYLDLFKRRARLLLITNDDWPAEDRLNADIEQGGWRPVLLSREPFLEMAPVVLSWTLEWGGWKPTRKATSLIIGGVDCKRA